MENSIFYEDIHEICQAEFVPWNELKNKTIFLTGATGLIGTTLIKVLSYANKEKNLNIHIIALVRDEKRATERFSEQLNEGILTFVAGSIENLPEIKSSIDYIIHGASQTASKEFVQHAVETIKTAVIGTQNMLELAKDKQVLGFVYLSSMEVYGFPQKGHKVTEDETGALSPLDLRNSYPLSKQVCEALCCAYSKEYQVPAAIIRLAQTLGKEFHHQDNRIFAYFAQCIQEKKNIILKTKGETERSYLHAIDASTAILTVLVKGIPGQAYNAADENTYCSIAEMALKIAKENNIKVCFDIQDEANNGFPQTLYMDLDTSLLKKFGWKPLKNINFYLNNSGEN